jgi:hypothetical protein
MKCLHVWFVFTSIALFEISIHVVSIPSIQKFNTQISHNLNFRYQKIAIFIKLSNCRNFLLKKFKCKFIKILVLLQLRWSAKS